MIEAAKNTTSASAIAAPTPVKEFLQGQGIPGNRMSTVSYGEERPVCRTETEECFSMNRRAHFAEAR
jgi:peptidoglycan-associated lipoprotein